MVGDLGFPYSYGVESLPEYLTSPEAALARAAKVEGALLTAADAALAVFLEQVIQDTLSGNFTRAGVLTRWRTALAQQLNHPVFSEIREDLLNQLGDSQFDDDVYSAGALAVAVAHNMGATDDERRALVERLFQGPTPPSLLASLSTRVDGWLRRRVSRILLKRLAALGPEDLSREDLVGREFEIPEAPGSSTLVTEDDWLEDDRPGEINWRARMRRDIRTAYTAIFGRQMQRQLEKHGFKNKVWISRKDERVRVTHLHADGQVVPLYENFRVGKALLRYPGDPLGLPGEIINCRCVLVGR